MIEQFPWWWYLALNVGYGLVTGAAGLNALRGDPGYWIGAIFLNVAILLRPR